MTHEESIKQFEEWQRLEDEWADKLISEMLTKGSAIVYSDKT
jgi:hypothetical protein